MNKTKYNLRHIKCNMDDFQIDRHRFRFTYCDKEYIASCYGKLEVEFDADGENNLPEDVQCEIQDIIWDKIDQNENRRWRYPAEAYEIADRYYAV